MPHENMDILTDFEGSVKKSPTDTSNFKKAFLALIQCVLNLIARLDASAFKAKSFFNPDIKGHARPNGSGAPYKIHYPFVGTILVRRAVLLDSDGKSVGFKPFFIEPLRRSLDERLDREIFSLYLKGLSNNEISRHLRQNHFRPLSHGAVSKRVKKLAKKALAEFSARDLSKVKCDILYADAPCQSIIVGGSRRKPAVIVVLGISKGRRELLAVSAEPNESEPAYRRVFGGLKRRGLKSPGLVCTDSHGSVRSAVAACFPGAVWQRRGVHHRRNAMKALKGASKPERLEICRDLSSIWDELTYAAAQRHLSRFVGRHGERFPEMAAKLLDGIEDTFAFYAFPEIDPKLPRGSNEVERINGHIRARTHKTRVFPDTASYTRLIVCHLLDRKEEWGGKILDDPEKISGAMANLDAKAASMRLGLERAMGKASPSPVLLLPAPSDSKDEILGNKGGSAGQSEGAQSRAPSACALEAAGIPGRVAALNGSPLGTDGRFLVQASAACARVPLKALHPEKAPVYYAFAVGISYAGKRRPLALVASSKGYGDAAERLAEILTKKLGPAPKVIVSRASWEEMGPGLFPGWGKTLWVAEWSPTVRDILSLVPRGARPEWEARLDGAKKAGGPVEMAAALGNLAGELSLSCPAAADALRSAAPSLAKSSALAAYGVSQGRLSSATLASKTLEESVKASAKRGPLEPAAAAMMAFESALSQAGEWALSKKSHLKAESILAAAEALDSGDLGGVLDKIEAIAGGGPRQIEAPA